VKVPLYIVGAAGAVFLTACTTTTLENRRDLYCPKNYFANGPYTQGVEYKKRVVKEVTVTRTTSDYKNVVRPSR
jgi:hypothetical protein